MKCKEWPEERAAIIAEIGSNHGGDPELAWEMIKSAHENGADFVKLQSFYADRFLHPSLEYFPAVKAMELSAEVQEELFRKAQTHGIALFSTPFDEDTVAFLERVDVPLFKIASMDLDNHSLIRRVARTGRPVLMSTGMASREEIAQALEVVRGEDNDAIVLMHCVSDYPTQPEDVNLRAVQGLAKDFDIATGLSDHSLGIHSAMAAIAMGAVVVEKHYTTQRELMDIHPNADNDISILPHELAELREFAENMRHMMGEYPRQLTEQEDAQRLGSRRGAYASRNLAKGEVLSENDIIFLRPVQGISAGDSGNYVGELLATDVKRLEPLRTELFRDES